MLSGKIKIYDQKIKYDQKKSNMWSKDSNTFRRIILFNINKTFYKRFIILVRKSLFDPLPFSGLDIKRHIM